jgi:replicative DNA helicase
VVGDTYQEAVMNAKQNAGVFNGLRTGIDALDKLTGGLSYGTMTTVLAETGMGKTTLMTSIASKLLEQANGVIIPTESSTMKWLGKLIAYITRIPTDDVEDGKITDMQAAEITSLVKALVAENVMIECQNPTPSLISAAVRGSIERLNLKWVIIDSLSKVDSDKRNASEFEDASAAADLAQMLALDLGLAVLSTSQVGRKMEGRASRIPQQNDGKGSGAIEENSDVLLSLYNHGVLVRRNMAEKDNRFPENKAMITCLKHRNRGKREGLSIYPTFVPGIGFYD